MHSEQVRLALEDIRDNAQLAKEFVAGLGVEDFAADHLRLYAVTRCLEIISEAARRLSPVVRDRHPELPWRAIMGSGNIYRHDYDNVAAAFVWRTVQQSLDPLLAVIQAELAVGDAEG